MDEVTFTAVREELGVRDNALMMLEEGEARCVRDETARLLRKALKDDAVVEAVVSAARRLMDEEVEQQAVELEQEARENERIAASLRKQISDARDVELD